LRLRNNRRSGHFSGLILIGLSLFHVACEGRIGIEALFWFGIGSMVG